MLKEDNEKKRCPKIEEKMETRKSNFLLGLCYSVACGSAFLVILYWRKTNKQTIQESTLLSTIFLSFYFVFIEGRLTKKQYKKVQYISQR